MSHKGNILFICFKPWKSLQSGLAQLFRRPRWFAKQPYKTIQLQASKSPDSIELTAILSLVTHRSVSVDLAELLSNSNLSPLQWIDHKIFQNEIMQLIPCIVCDHVTLNVISALRASSLSPIEM